MYVVFENVYLEKAFDSIAYKLIYKVLFLGGLEKYNLLG